MAKGLDKSLPCPKDCYFLGYRGDCCDYNYLTASSRGCAPGPDCVRYRPRGDAKRPKSIPPQPRHAVEGYVRRPGSVQSLEADPKVLEMWEAGASDPEIARETGWARSTVQRWRLVTGRPSRRRRTSLMDREEEAVRLYEAGESDKAIARALGCSAAGVSSWRRRTGRARNRPPGWPGKGSAGG